MKMSEPRRCPYCGDLLTEFSVCWCMESDDSYEYPGDEDIFEDDYFEDEDDFDDELM